MVVGQLLLSAFFQVLFDRLASRELLEFARQEGVRSKLKKWDETLMMIQAVLSDAEEKQLTDGAVKMWLDNLRDLAYDAEDILDEVATEALRRKSMAKHKTSTSKVRNLIPVSCTSLRFNASIGSKIEGISCRLEQLCKQRIELGLQVIPGGLSTSTARERPPCTSVPTEAAVYGRDEDKAKILEMMLRDEAVDANYRVITIFGMAGLGKTTLAREVYNDKALDDFRFDIKAWVSVSENFDILKISKALLETVNSSPCGLNDLNEVQIQLKKAADGKKFLLVLDDVWNRNYGLWETLKSPFMAGAPGSKIIVTTRNLDVALTIGPVNYYELKRISDDDCWCVFIKHAFDGRDIDAHRIPELVRKKVVEKCGGLPLAARTLGGLLRSNQSDDAWEDILRSKIWDLPKESGILPVLRLSYHDLPSHLIKRCFAYCAIFPKDYEFEAKELVLLWMAEGIIHGSEKNKQLEDLGSEYFQDLLSRSIFQQSSSDSSKFVMHNLVNDLAQWVSGDTSFRLEEADKESKRLGRARHSSFTCTYYDGENKFEALHDVKRLRTLLPVLMSGYGSYRGSHISNMVISDLLPKFKKLRVLSLTRYYITKLPNSIGGLRHLRYLNLSRTLVRSLPESTSSLVNLQTLILEDCFRLMKLPAKIRNLVNLRHLDITGTNLLKEMPLGMKELKNLRHCLILLWETMSALVCRI